MRVDINRVFLHLLSLFHFAVVVHVLSSPSAHRQVLDFLHDYVTSASNLTLTMTPIPSQDGRSTAYVFKDIKDGGRFVRAASSIVEVARRLIRTSDDGFTFVVLFRQQTNNIGTIFSYGSDSHSYIELESNGWRKELRLHYTHRSRTRTEVFKYDLADNLWHKIAISFSASANYIKIFIDCESLFERRLETPLFQHLRSETTTSLTKTTTPPAAEAERTGTGEGERRDDLWIGQRDSRHGYFKGAIEYVQLVSSSEGYLQQCPQANVGCPTCNDFQRLEQLVHSLQSSIVALDERLFAATQRIIELEKCECRKECEVDGQTYRDGDVVQSNLRCTECSCRGGEVVCKKQTCPSVDCDNSMVPEGACCPVCPKRCLFYGSHYDEGEIFSPKPCRTCTCQDGHVKCQTEEKSNCPVLSCPKGQQIQVHGACCKVCKGTNFCAAASVRCPENSACINLATKYTCLCNVGFVMRGKTCTDIDECSIVGGIHGHHCNVHSKCVNTVGSYSCQCLPGFERVDAYNCRDIDECRTGELSRQCSAHAVCVNRPGFYSCQCAEGYSGDGFSCSPICSGLCQNGGRCVEPNVCHCRQGFMGEDCQTDIDECSQGFALCHPNSICVNMPGAYLCECKVGFHSAQPDNQHGALCADLDECQGWGDGHSCTDETVCKNTEGSYECVCTDPLKCTCTRNGTSHQSGTKWPSETDKCSSCRCQTGRVICEQNKCDCENSSNQMSDCCEHCRSRDQCKHQQFQLLFNEGETWRHQCQSCQCQPGGEVDCQAVSCPELACSRTELLEGDCCPRCADTPDVCSSQDLYTDLFKTCVVDGKTVQSFQKWSAGADLCSSCQCLGGHICCSYNKSCQASKNIPASHSTYSTGTLGHEPNVQSLPSGTTHRRSSKNSRRPIYVVSDEGVPTQESGLHRTRHRNSGSRSSAFTDLIDSDTDTRRHKD